jgi:hypothetical protein
MSMPEHKLDLTTFILSVSSAAYMGLGIVPPGSGLKAEFNLELARQNIDLLELLLEKTQGNRTPDEDRLLTQLLFETRMRYVEAQKKQQS